jgi:hypothetical protein
VFGEYREILIQIIGRFREREAEEDMSMKEINV